MTFLALQSTDHSARGVARFIEQYKDKDKLTAMLESYLDRVQDLENDIWEVIGAYLLDTAEGVQLDKIGKIVGQQRNSTDDAVFRLSIRAAIRINISEGTAEDILELARLILPEDSTWHYEEYFPAQIRIEFIDQLTDLVDPQLIAFLFFRCRSAGVAFRFEYKKIRDYDDYLTFDSVSGGTRTVTNAGLGTVENTTTGGKLISVLNPAPEKATNPGPPGEPGFNTGFDTGFDIT